MMGATPQPAVPSLLLGTWKVGHVYDTPGPTDLDQHQNIQIQKLRLEIAFDAIKVCGRNIAIKKADLSLFTPDQFATRYGVAPNRIGLNGAKITELQINSLELTHACGEFSDPGTDVIFDEQNHFAIEVDNLYYKLSRTK